jgi:hypothetical protein
MGDSVDDFIVHNIKATTLSGLVALRQNLSFPISGKWPENQPRDQSVIALLRSDARKRGVIRSFATP